LLPHSDFTRPDEEESFSKMQMEQLFETVEAISPEAWKRNRQSILNRYAQLALESKIAPEAFLEHMHNVMEKEFNEVWSRDKKQWTAGGKYYVEQAERTRSIMETVLRHSRLNFLDDDFLARYYSGTDQITDSGSFIYPGGRSEEEVINGLASETTFSSKESPLSTCALWVLSLLMDVAPQKCGKKTIAFIVAMAYAARERYAIFSRDSHGWYEHDYGTAPLLDTAYEAFDSHPEYFAKELLESPRFSEIVEFLLFPSKKATPPSPRLAMMLDQRYSSERLEEDKGFLSEQMLQALIEHNSVEGKQADVLKVCAKKVSGIAGERILQDWEKIDLLVLISLLGIAQPITVPILKSMDRLFAEYHFKHRAIALYLATHPQIFIYHSAVFPIN